MTQEINERAFSVQLLVILQIGSGLSLSLGSLLVPIYTGLSWLIFGIVSGLFVLGLVIARLGYQLGQRPSRKLWWLSFIIFTSIVLVFVRHLYFSYANFPSLEQIEAENLDRKVARIFLNTIIFILFFSCWIQLIRNRKSLSR